MNEFDQPPTYSAAARAVMDHHFQVEMPEERLSAFLQQHARYEAHGLINTGSLARHVLTIETAEAGGEDDDDDDLYQYMGISKPAYERLRALRREEPELWRESAELTSGLISVWCASLVMGLGETEADTIRQRAGGLLWRQAELMTEIFYKLEPLEPEMALELCL